MKTCNDVRSRGSVAIVGAGPGGATLARLLHRQDYAVRILERDASPTARPQGGSLDLRPDSGRRAIDEAGLGDIFETRSRAEAKAFRMIDSSGDELPGMGQETHEDAGPEIDRGDLRAMLLEALPPGLVAWDHEVERVEPEADGRWRLEVAGRAPVIANLVIGADGIGSKVRQRLTDVQPAYTGITMVAATIRKELWRGSEISDVLGEGSVMYAGGNKTIFVQRCAHDLILLYYAMAVPQGWPRPDGFDVDDTGAVLAACARGLSRLVACGSRDADPDPGGGPALADVGDAARLPLGDAGGSDDAGRCVARHVAVHRQGREPGLGRRARTLAFIERRSRPRPDRRHRRLRAPDAGPHQPRDPCLPGDRQAGLRHGSQLRRRPRGLIRSVAHSPLPAERTPMRQTSSGSASAEELHSIADALRRFGAGTDDGNAALLASAFSEDAMVDFSPCGRKLGLDFEPLRGREAIVGFLAGGADHQMTSHVIANSRAWLRDGRAKLRALVEATHIPKVDRGQPFRMLNWYDAELGPDPGAWRIEALVVDNIWFDGDPRTILRR